MPRTPNKYKPITVTTRQRTSRQAVIGFGWIYALLLALYFGDELQVSMANQRHPLAPSIVQLVEHSSNTVPLSALKNRINGAAQTLYQQDYRFGTIANPAPPEPVVVAVVSAQAETIKEEQGPEKSVDVLPEPPSLPTNVLLVGSSSMRSSMGAALSKLLKQSAKVNVERHAKIGTGLSRPDVYDWHSKTLELIDKHNIDLVVAQFIGNDCQNLVNRDMSVGSSLTSNTWGESYQQRVTEYVQAIQDTGAEVVLIGMPIVRSPRFTRRLAYANGLVEQVASDTGAIFIPTWEASTDEDGNYQESFRVDGRTLKFRHEDGIHLSHAGSQYVARDIYDQLKEHYPWEAPQSNASVALPTTIRQ